MHTEKEKFNAKVKVTVTQLCPTLCNPMDYIVHGILQARRLEWVAVPFSRGSSQCRDLTQAPSCRRILRHWATRESLLSALVSVTADGTDVCADA